MPRQPGHVSRQGGAATDGMASIAVPDKGKGHVGSALNAFVLWCHTINLYTVDTFHLRCGTVATPLTYKRKPKAYYGRIRSLLDWACTTASSRTQENQIYTDKQD